MENLEPELMRRASTILYHPEEVLGKIGTTDLVVVFSEFGFWPSSASCVEAMIAATRSPRSRPLRIPFVLFNSESEPYRFVGQRYFEASSGDTVGLLHQTVHAYIQCLPAFDGETGYNIIVYEVRWPTSMWPDH